MHGISTRTFAATAAFPRGRVPGSAGLVVKAGELHNERDTKWEKRVVWPDGHLWRVCDTFRRCRILHVFSSIHASATDTNIAVECAGVQLCAETHGAAVCHKALSPCCANIFLSQHTDTGLAGIHTTRSAGCHPLLTMSCPPLPSLPASSSSFTPCAGMPRDQGARAAGGARYGSR